MDFSTGGIFTSLILGVVGMALIMYGKKNERLYPALAGIVLCVVPYVLASLLLQWLTAGACMGGLWWLSRDA